MALARPARCSPAARPGLPAPKGRPTPGGGKRAANCELGSRKAVNNSSPPLAGLRPPLSADPFPAARPCRAGARPTSRTQRLSEPRLCASEKGRRVRDGTGVGQGPTSSLSSVPATNSPAAARASSGSHTENNRADRAAAVSLAYPLTQRETKELNLGQKT